MLSELLSDSNVCVMYKAVTKLKLNFHQGIQIIGLNGLG